MATGKAWASVPAYQRGLCHLHGNESSPGEVQGARRIIFVWLWHWGASFVFFLFWLVRLCLKGMRAILPDKSHRWLQCSKGQATSS